MIFNKIKIICQCLPYGIVGGLQSLEPEVVKGVEVSQLSNGIRADVSPLQGGGHEGVVEPGNPEL